VGGRHCELSKPGTTPDEHGGEPGRVRRRDEAAHGCGVYSAWRRPFSFGLSLPVAHVETVGSPVWADEAGSDQIPSGETLTRDDVVVADVALRAESPTFGDVTQIRFEVAMTFLSPATVRRVGEARV